MRDCKFALCHINKSKKKALEGYSKANMDNMIKIVPSSDKSVQNRAESAQSHTSFCEGIPSKRISARIKTPQHQHQNLNEIDKLETDEFYSDVIYEANRQRKKNNKFDFKSQQKL